MVTIASYASLAISFLAIIGTISGGTAPHKCIKHHHLLLLIGAAVLDDALESPRLQLHLHQECPTRVISLGEGRVATPASNLRNHPLDHNSICGGVIIVGSLASRHLHNKDWKLALIPLVRTLPEK
jgi:hypothetical protein